LCPLKDESFIQANTGDSIMKMLTTTAIALALATTVASAQVTQPAPAPTPSAQTHEAFTTIPADSNTVTHWYKQNVYDPSDNKIGEIMDVLVTKDGKINALIVGVGGFLGIGEKDVAVSFESVAFKPKDNNKWYLVMNTTKDALKGAPGYKFDRNSMAWIPENAPATTGGPATAPAVPRPSAR
jgi:sporulation protein YlmC with PRC-barrel domain